jgi:hypothetical protein
LGKVLLKYWPSRIRRSFSFLCEGQPHSTYRNKNGHSLSSLPHLDREAFRS